MTTPVSVIPALSPELLDGIVARAARPDFPAFEAQLRSSGYCARPVRLRGTIQTSDHDGHRRVWSTKDEPDGVLRKACGNRREAVCPPCAERYRQDAYHLITAGLRGGKGVRDSVAGHPAVFFTLTAPTFGPVHTQPVGANGQPLPCRARRDAPVCPHGVPLSCGAMHADDHPCLGEPLCPRCFDYRAAVIWNHTLGTLWRAVVRVRDAQGRAARAAQRLARALSSTGARSDPGRAADVSGAVRGRRARPSGRQRGRQLRTAQGGAARAAAAELPRAP